MFAVTNIDSIEACMKITNVDELFSRSWELYKKHFLKVIVLSLIPLLGAIPLVVVGVAAGFIFNNNGFLGGGNILLVLLFVLLFMVTGLFAAYVAFSAQAGIMVYLKRIHQNKIPEIWESFNTARQKYLISYVGANIVYIVLVVLWSLLLLIPGFIFFVFYLFGTWIVVFKDKKALSALEKSVELVKGYWWALVGRMAVLYIIIYAIMFLPTLITNNQVFLDAWGVFTQIFSLLVGPFVVFYIFLIFKDLLKIKKQ